MLTPSFLHEKIYLDMNELNLQSLEKALALKIQEIDSLKAQNGRLIEKLQEEIINYLEVDGKKIKDTCLNFGYK